jgi:hypothetical protein
MVAKRVFNSKFRRVSLWLVSLLSVLVGICGWIGYEVSWIQQRHAFLQSQSAVWESTGVSTQSAKWHLVTAPSERNQESPKAPGLLWLFGETGVPAIDLLIRDELAERDVRRVRYDRDGSFLRAKQLFPEATVAVSGWDRSEDGLRDVNSFISVKASDQSSLEDE